jgi:hypothetical protein
VSVRASVVRCGEEEGSGLERDDCLEVISEGCRAAGFHTAVGIARFTVTEAEKRNAKSDDTQKESSLLLSRKP